MKSAKRRQWMAGGAGSSRTKRRTKEAGMKHLKPILITAAITLITIAIVRRVSLLNNLVFGA